MSWETSGAAPLKKAKTIGFFVRRRRLSRQLSKIEESGSPVSEASIPKGPKALRRSRLSNKTYSPVKKEPSLERLRWDLL